MKLTVTHTIQGWNAKAMRSYDLSADEIFEALMRLRAEYPSVQWTLRAAAPTELTFKGETDQLRDWANPSPGVPFQVVGLKDQPRG